MLIISMTAVIYAQNIEFKVSDYKLEFSRTYELHRIVDGVEDGQVLLVAPSISNFMDLNVKDVKIHLLDSVGHKLKEVVILNTKDWYVKAAFRVENNLHLLLGYVTEEKLSLRHVALDARSLASVDDEILYTESLGKEYQYGSINVEGSPSGQYYGAVCSIWNDEGDGKTVAILYNKEMEKLWEYRLASSGNKNVMVSDEGFLLIMQIGTVVGENNMTVFRFNYIDDRGYVYTDYVLDAHVGQAVLLNCIKEKVLVTAMENIEFNPDVPQKYTQIYGLVFDLKTEKITYKTKHEFTRQELRAIYNHDNTSIPSGGVVDRLCSIDHCITSQGGAVIYQRRYWSSDSYSVSYYCRGMVLVQADMEGSLTVDVIPHWTTSDYYPITDVFEYGGNVYVMTNENKKSKEIYDPDEIASNKTYSAIAAYRFTPDGDVTKQMLDRKFKGLLRTPLYATREGKFYFITSLLSKRNVCTITIPR